MSSNSLLHSAGESRRPYVLLQPVHRRRDGLPPRLPVVGGHGLVEVQLQLLTQLQGRREEQVNTRERVQQNGAKIVLARGEV